MTAAESIANQMSEIVMKRVEGDRLVLPTIPVAAQKALDLLKDPDVNLKSVARALERDPLLAARILRLASSAAMGTHVTSIEQAVARVGGKKLKVLLLDASAKKVFESRDARIARTFHELWDHSLAVGLLARDVAALCGSEDPEVAYLAGLLHDIGKPVLGSMLLEAEKMIVGSRPGAAWIRPEEWLAAIDSAHRRVGQAIAERWQLPEAVAKVIADPSEYDSSNRKAPVNAVRFANALAKAQGFHVGHVDLEDANAMVMIGRSLLSIEDEPVKHLIATLKDRLKADAA